jgi:hypothetical protein
MCFNSFNIFYDSILNPNALLTETRLGGCGFTGYGYGYDVDQGNPILTRTRETRIREPAGYSIPVSNTTNTLTHHNEL